MAYNKTTNSNQLITGSPLSNPGAWTITINTTGGGGGAVWTATLPSRDNISVGDTYTYPVTDGVYTAGQELRVTRVNYATGAVTFNIAGAAGAGTAAAVLTSTSYNNEVNYVFMGDQNQAVTTTRQIYYQAGFDYTTPAGVPTWTGINTLGNGDIIELISTEAILGNNRIDVTIKLNDLYYLDTATGTQTRGIYTLNVALRAVSTGNLYVLGTLSLDEIGISDVYSGNVIVLKGLSTTVVNPVGPANIDCDLIIINNDQSGDDLEVDLEASISITK